MYLDLWEKSDLSAQEFCRNNNLKNSTFDKWMRIQRQGVVKLMPIEIEQTKPITGTMTLKLPCGIECVFNTLSDMKSIVSLIKEYEACN